MVLKIEMLDIKFDIYEQFKPLKNKNKVIRMVIWDRIDEIIMRPIVKFY